MAKQGITIAVVEAIKRRADERARRRIDVSLKDRGRILRYQAGVFLVVGGFGALFFFAMGLLSWFGEDDPGMRTFVTSGHAFFAFMCLLLINEGRAVVWLDSVGVGTKSPWRWWSVELRWEDVTELRWGGRALMWYRIKGAARTIRVHAWLGGRLLEDYFARHLSEEIAREAIAEANLVERHKWREFWRTRVDEAEERIEE